MNEQIINYETAKLAAEKGFHFKTTYDYLDLAEHKETIYGHGKYHDDVLGEEIVPEKLGVLTDNAPYYKYVKAFYFAPTQSLLQKWLRDYHKINIVVDIIYDINQYCFKVHRTNAEDFAEIVNRFGHKAEEFSYPTYEDALELALIKALNMVDV